MKLKTPAKVNLYLNVSSKDKEGYHLIETLFHSISITDTIDIKINNKEKTTLKITGEFTSLLRNKKDNIILKAVNLFFSATGLNNPGLDITLEKNIPVSAGLGGGSSDAAAVLTILNKLFKTRFSRTEFCRLGSELGSDVNFFFYSGTAVGYGRGETLTKKTLTLPGWFIVIYPRIEISARFAYENLEKKVLTNNQNNIIIVNLLKKINRFMLFEIAKNDLQDFLIKKYPILGDLITSLKKAGAQVSLLSGSGSCVFGYFDRRPDLKDFQINRKVRVFLAKSSWGIAKR